MTMKKDAEPTGEATPKTHRRRRASTGGFALKLTAPERAGFVRRWVKNEPGRVLEMRDLGYDFAEADAATDGLGTRIERFGGRDANGAPQNMILMETPVSEYSVGVAEKEDRLKPFEEALRKGRDTTGKLEGTYEKASVGSISHNAA